MPIYEYFCPGCGKTFELMCPFSQSDAPASCPVCRTRGRSCSLLCFQIRVLYQDSGQGALRNLPAGTALPRRSRDGAQEATRGFGQGTARRAGASLPE